MPAFANTRTSKLVAVVSGDKAKRRQIQRAYPGVRAYGYEDVDACLASEDVDAVYIAEPNTLHAEFAVRAAKAGVHVLCEKPMAPTEEECRHIIAACEDTDVKLMIAYRLHFEEANLRAVDLVREGYAQQSANAEVYDFIRDMSGAYARADAIVCRAGATTLAELTVAKKPAILIPLRTLDGHALQPMDPGRR